MKVIIKKDGEDLKELQFKGTVKELLSKLKINPEEVLVARNNEIVEEDEPLLDKDTITIFSVISGG